MHSINSRRIFVKKTLIAAGSIPVGLWFWSCKSKDQTKTEEQDSSREVSVCDDLSKVQEVELKKRRSLGYTETSPISENLCSNCNLYIPPKDNQTCGGCILFKGPVLESAYCTYWAAQENNSTI